MINSVNRFFKIIIIKLLNYSDFTRSSARSITTTTLFNASSLKQFSQSITLYIKAPISLGEHLWLRGELGGRELRQPKAHPRLPNMDQNKVLLYLPPFGGIPMSNYGPEFDLPPQVGGLGWTFGIKNGAF